MAEIRLMRPLQLYAPAKLNLGLEITGRRSEGYHEIVTLLQAVDYFDEIRLTPADAFSYVGDPRIPEDDDLILRALRISRARFGLSLCARVQLVKHIPMSAGLGGGSSDAGTLLAALGVLGAVPEEELLEVAAELGSDVPFFIRGGSALATGTGTELEALPTEPRDSPGWFVIVTPNLQIPRKTAVLYSSLRPDDFSDGSATRELAEQLRQTNSFDPRLMRNGFARSLYEYPPIVKARDAMLRAGARTILPSGAGPSLYSPFESCDEAQAVAAELNVAGENAGVLVTIGPGFNDERLRSALGQ